MSAKHEVVGVCGPRFHGGTMNIENQVTSLELSKRLKESGVKQDSIFTWTDDPAGKPYIAYLQDKNYSYHYSAFTVAELGEMLPPFVTTEKYLCQLKPRFNAQECETIEQHTWHDDQEADARAKMLIHLIENGMVKP